MDNLGIFYDHLVSFTAIGNILWPFGIFYGHLVYFSYFGMFGPRKIWQPWGMYVQEGDLSGEKFLESIDPWKTEEISDEKKSFKCLFAVRSSTIECTHSLPPPSIWKWFYSSYLLSHLPKHSVCLVFFSHSNLFAYSLYCVAFTFMLIFLISNAIYN
jgi:hypothetical protein